MRNKGDLVKINFKKLEAVSDVIKNIKKFDKKYNKVHKITNIYTKNIYTKNEYSRYELDGEFVFNESEIEDFII